MDDKVTRFEPVAPYDEEDGCVIVALSIILEKSYNDIRKSIGDNFRDYNIVRGYLQKHNFHEVEIPLKFCKKRMTVSKLTEISLNKSLICFCGDHIVTIKDGKYYDTVDSGEMCVFSYFIK
jgi:hypothetical protein